MKRREQHAYGTQSDTLAYDGTYLRELGTHTTGKKNDRECHNTDGLHAPHIAKMYTNTIYAKEHTRQQEEEQGWYSKAGSYLTQ